MIASPGFEQNLPLWWSLVLIGAAALAVALYLIWNRRQDHSKD